MNHVHFLICRTTLIQICRHTDMTESRHHRQTYIIWLSTHGALGHLEQYNAETKLSEISNASHNMQKLRKSTDSDITQPKETQTLAWPTLTSVTEAMCSIMEHECSRCCRIPIGMEASFANLGIHELFGPRKILPQGCFLVGKEVVLQHFIVFEPFLQQILEMLHGWSDLFDPCMAGIGIRQRVKKPGKGAHLLALGRFDTVLEKVECAL